MKLSKDRLASILPDAGKFSSCTNVFFCHSLGFICEISGKSAQSAMLAKRADKYILWGYAPHSRSRGCFADNADYHQNIIRTGGKFFRDIAKLIIGGVLLAGINAV